LRLIAAISKLKAEKEVDEIYQAVQLKKYLDFQRDAFIHRNGAKNAKI
jgi:hypothetical protein